MKNSILIVEDEQDIRDALQEFLEDEGYAVATATNGAEAFEVLASIPHPDVILLDLLMPVMNGIEFTEQQRKHPRYAHIPVVIMSADTYVKRKATDLNLKFLKKPLELDELLSTIKKCSEAQPDLIPNAEVRA